MNCKEAQETILDSVAGLIPPDQHLAIENHIAKCEVCHGFAEIQRVLDVRLAAAVPVVSLSPGFRRSLQEKLHRHATAGWSESLPDIAHLIGCVFAIVLLLLLLPEYSKIVVSVGAVFTAATYFFQAILRSSLERLERNA